MANYIVTSEGRRLRKVAMRTTTPVDDSAAKAVNVEAPRVCYNMLNEEFFPLMMHLRDKAVHLMGDRLAELARWSAADRDKVLLWFGDDSETIRQTLSDGLTRMREIMRGLTEKNFIQFTPEGVRAVGCEPLPRKPGEHPATASVCRIDETLTIFIGTPFCAMPDEITDYKGVPLDGDSKLLTLIHEISHFRRAMDTGDPWYSTSYSKIKAMLGDKAVISNADNVAGYVVNIGR